MRSLGDKRVAVIGLDSYGLAACELLAEHGAIVRAIDPGSPARAVGVETVLARLGIKVDTELRGMAVDMVVTSPAAWTGGISPRAPHPAALPVMSELELGYRQCFCLVVAVAGTNGKSTVASMIARVLELGQRRVRVAGQEEMPFCRVASESRDQDFMVVEASFGQLEGIDHFRPAVAVLLNLTPTLPARYLAKSELARCGARLFANQQCFDWAVIQSEALAELRAAGYEPPSKVITFSASNRRADLWYDRGLLQSRIEGWTGPLLDIAKCRVQGPHQAENLMAALAVGHVMKIPLETMVTALKDVEAGPDVHESIGERGGVVYVCDARSSNPEALRQALRSVAPGAGGEPNIWLIAGGEDDGYEYHDLGPLLSRRVKRVFLLGAVAVRMRAAWSLFTPCTVVSSLLEAVQNAADMAERGDVVLFSPACSSCSAPSSESLRGKSFREAVRQLAGSAGGNPEFKQPAI
jgi:UDP-N-acetylmuramoylalanine--D-glutamate ligase